MTGKGRSGHFTTTILIGILSACVFAGARPYDGTVWDNAPSSLPPGVIHGTYHSTVMNVDVGYNIYLPPQYPDPVLSGDLLVPCKWW